MLVPLKTARSRQTLRVPPSLVASLAAHRRRQAETRLLLGPAWGNDDDLVFTTPLGTPVDPRNFLREVGRITDAAGIGKHHVHALRHPAASILFALGEEMKVVSEVLGHSSERVTSEVYVHLTQERRDAAVVRLDEALRQRPAG